jgi:hypothetical protein
MTIHRRARAIRDARDAVDQSSAVLLVERERRVARATTGNDRQVLGEWIVEENARWEVVPRFWDRAAVDARCQCSLISRFGKAKGKRAKGKEQKTGCGLKLFPFALTAFDSSSAPRVRAW